MDGLVSEIEIAQEKASMMCTELMQEYFSLQNERDIHEYYNMARVQNDVVHDYIYEIGKVLQAARKLLNSGEMAAENIV